MALWITKYWTWKDWVSKFEKWWNRKLLNHIETMILQQMTFDLKACQTENWISEFSFMKNYFFSWVCIMCRIICHIIWPNLSRLFKTIERIINRRGQNYFYPYKNADFKQISWYQQLFNFVSRFLYFITGPKFVVPILGIVQQKGNIRT